MNNTIMRNIAVTGAYQPLVDTDLTGSVAISCPPSNQGVVFFKGDDDSDVPWQPGQWHDFQRINLADIEIKGTPGDTVTVIGGTW